MIYSRHTDYEHYVKCQCGWEGWSAWMRHGYQATCYAGVSDVEPVDFCPKCDTPESFTDVVTCHRNCTECNERFFCYTTLTKIPIEASLHSEHWRHKNR